ncbi:MAG TPA: HD domain-containing protein [Solirubrobacteraceae bacterium]|nr:HD domain-containing protein [Solirubrobacteraceae bacterium]
MTSGDPLAALAAILDEGWLVGGAVRDRALGRPTSDFDVAITGRVPEIARALGRSAHGYAFELSEAFGAWRVVAHDHSWQLDLLPLDGETIEEDLSHRDLTINAIAAPIGSGGYIDPFGGLADLRRRRLRRVADDAFERDPLRAMRLARLGCELEFDPEPETLALARASAGRLGDVAPERVFIELRRVLVADRARQGLELMDRAGALDAVLPELAALKGVAQSRFHHLDVFEHTLAVLDEVIALEREPERLAGVDAGALRGLLDEPLANELTRGQALRFGALLHDIAKPQTRAVNAQGRVTFMGHDASGAELASAILGRLRASERLREHVAALTRHHLRLGFLVHEMPLRRRAVYDYLHATTPVAVDVIVLSVADRLATRGDNAERAIALHLELARQMVAEALAWLADPPRPPVRGDDLARALGIRPGPVVGGLLAELQAESFSGEVAGREQAIERARELIAQDGQ